MVERLRPWIECESPTYDAAAVNRMMDLAAYDLTVAGAVVERIPGRMGFGGSVRARFPHPDFGKPGILIAGHMDTVHPIGTLEKLPFKREGDICYGPGIMDMKGGNFISLEAIKALAMAGMQTPLPVTVLFTPDEEVGTPSTRELIEAEAAQEQICPCPRTRQAGRRRGDRPLCHRALQPAHGGPSQPRGLGAGRRPLRHRRHGEKDPRDRGDDLR